METTAESLAFNLLGPNDQALYTALQETVVQIRKTLAMQGIERDARETLFNSLADCQKTQNKLLRRVQSLEDTQASDIRAFKKVTV